MKQSKKENISKLPECFIEEFYSGDKPIAELVNNTRCIASFAGGGTYDLVNETCVHAHPLCKGYTSNVAPFIMLRAKGGVSDQLFQVLQTVDLKPYDKSAVNELASVYPNIVEYITKRMLDRRFDKAPIYRFYILRRAYIFKPAFELGYNPQGLTYLSFDDIRIANPESLVVNLVSLYLDYKT